MEIETPATETIAETIAPQETPEQDDAEDRIAALEAEKAAILERESNYKQAYLKEFEKNRAIPENESDEDRIRRITREELAAKEVATIDTEKEELLKKLAKENKELKLAQMNKTGAPPASVGTHSEGTPVTDTLVTPDQMAIFKSKGWSDQDIERYKQNLLKNTR